MKRWRQWTPSAARVLIRACTRALQQHDPLPRLAAFCAATAHMPRMTPWSPGEWTRLPVRRLIIIGVMAVLATLWTTQTPPTPPGSSHASRAADAVSHEDAAASVIHVIAQYCAMEQIAARRLDPTVLDPYLAPDSPWRQRRYAALAQRAAQHRPHRARLASWQVRHVSIADTQAQVITAEVWENQEVAMPAPASALVVVTYDMRRIGDAWRIWDLTIRPWP